MTARAAIVGLVAFVAFVAPGRAAALVSCPVAPPEYVGGDAAVQELRELRAETASSCAASADREAEARAQLRAQNGEVLGALGLVGGLLIVALIAPSLRSVWTP